VCRKIARKVVRSERKKRSFRVADRNLDRYLGVPRYNTSAPDKADDIGLASGLAVTQVGGELLQTEVTVLPGRGKLVLTGKLGDVMQESAQAAMSYVRSRAVSFGLDPHFYQKVDIHVHLPEGAIPKDGPSAGITIAAAMVSSLLQIPLRREVAMTGEITLRGRILPIGGLKEKLLAADRNDISIVLIPEGNTKDLVDIPPKVRRRLEIRPVSQMDEVVRSALRLSDPETFLAEPSRAVDWRVTHDSPSPSSH
jgi:ATP-dependent Lon protease